MLALQDAQQALRLSLISKKDIAWEVVQHLYKEQLALDAHTINQTLLAKAQKHTTTSSNSLLARLRNTDTTIPLSYGRDYSFEVGSVVMVLEPDVIQEKGEYDLELFLTHPITWEEIVLNKEVQASSKPRTTIIFNNIKEYVVWTWKQVAWYSTQHIL
jgi:hypothetical protein